MTALGTMTAHSAEAACDRGIRDRTRRQHLDARAAIPRSPPLDRSEGPATTDTCARAASAAIERLIVELDQESKARSAALADARTK